MPVEYKEPELKITSSSISELSESISVLLITYDNLQVQNKPKTSFCFKLQNGIGFNPVKLLCLPNINFFSL